METSADTSSQACASCGKQTGENAKFCPYCGAVPKPPTQETQRDQLTTTQKADAKPMPVAEVTLRASDNVWEHTEPEGEVKHGVQRSLLVLDEQSVHLSHTDNDLPPEILLGRIEEIIEAYSVPVEVKLTTVRWQSDSTEVRQRIIAFLKDHAYSDYKMIFGVDYMGKWASIKMYLAFEPPMVPPPPPPPAEPPYPPQVVPGWSALSYLWFLIAGISLVGGAIATSQFPGGSSLIFGICVATICSFIALSTRGNDTDAKNKQRDEEISKIKARHQRELEKYEEDVKEARRDLEFNSMAKSFLRTYKVDDMRLFSSAMRVVFQVVVNDIVQKDGAKVEKIEGGKGGFLSEDGIISIAQAPLQEDAAENFNL